jgi:hypothetical protein
MFVEPADEDQAVAREREFHMTEAAASWTTAMTNSSTLLLAEADLRAWWKSSHCSWRA